MIWSDLEYAVQEHLALLYHQITESKCFGEKTGFKSSFKYCQAEAATW